MDYFFISNTLLFRGTTEDETRSMLGCLNAYTQKYARGETVYHAGDTAEAMGLVLSGGIIIENNDVWGNKSILAHIEAGQVFAETYACIPGEPLMVNAVACESTEVLFLSVEKLLTTCNNSCEHHIKLIKNLLMLTARKNLALSRRILHTSSKSIRGRLLSYFSERSKLCGSPRFTIPFNRGQLADYLGVDRSALSNELSKMHKDGVLEYDKNSFTIMRGE